MNSKIIKIAVLVFVVVAVFLAASCGTTELTAPTDLSATDGGADNPDRINLSWLPVDGADIYYVYRGDTEDGSYTHVGQSVTSADVENADGKTELRYLFIENLDEGGSYWYRVTAASNIDASAESAMSKAVEASTYEDTWSDAPKNLGTASHIELAADTTTLYAVYSGGGSGDSVNMQTYADDENSDADNPPKIWTAVSVSPGNTDGTADKPFSIFITGGELYAAFNDNGAAGYVTMKSYTEGSWTLLGTQGFNGAAADLLSASVAGFAGTIYAGFVDGTDAAKLYKYNTTLSDWDIRADLVMPTDVVSVQLLSFNNNLYYGYEDNTTAGLYLRAYDDTEESLQAVNTATTVTTSDIDNGNAVFVSGGGSLYAVYITSGGDFEARQLVDNVWTALSNTTGAPRTAAGKGYGTIDAVWYDNSLYVFYLNNTDGNNGWIKHYDADAGWQSAEKNGQAVTGGGTVTKVRLASSLGVLYAGWIEDGHAWVSILE